MSKKIKWIDRALIISPVHYGLCKTENAFKKELKRLGIKRKDWPDYLTSTHANATVHYFENDGKTIAIVCMGNTDGRTANEIVGLLIHEAVHIWQEIKATIGEANPSREFEAYSIQCIAQKLIEAYSDE